MAHIIISKRNYLDNCTISKWTYKGSFICYSIEKPWINNEPYKSCIPFGDYVIKKTSTKTHRDCFYLENKNLSVSLLDNTVRTSILIHVANFVEDIKGCIGPGLTLHPNKWGVAYSAKAMDMLNKLILNNEDWILRIV